MSIVSCTSWYSFLGENVQGKFKLLLKILRCSMNELDEIRENGRRKSWLKSWPLYKMRKNLSISFPMTLWKLWYSLVISNLHYKFRKTFRKYQLTFNGVSVLWWLYLFIHTHLFVYVTLFFYIALKYWLCSYFCSRVTIY